MLDEATITAIEDRIRVAEERLDAKYDSGQLQYSALNLEGVKFLNEAENLLYAAENPLSASGLILLDRITNVWVAFMRRKHMFGIEEYLGRTGRNS